MYKFLNPLLFTLSLIALPFSAIAEKADRDKPMNIEAVRVLIDDLKQTAFATGRVVVSKGTIQIRGAELNAREDAQGYQYGTVVAEAGKLAFFRQKRDAVDEFVEGEAETIVYDGRADTVRFVGRAQLRRFRGAVLNDDMSGSVIVFDNLNGKFSADGKPSTGAIRMPGERVRATLTPKPALPVSAPSPGGLPTVPGLTVAPSPVLRNSSSLGQGQK